MRPPSARSNALSEIEMNESHASSFKGGVPARRNNLVAGPDQAEERKRPPHRVPSMSASFKDDQSQVSMSSGNPFYGQYVAKAQEERRAQQHLREQ